MSWAAAIGAGASLLGGMMGSKSAKDAAEDQMMANEANAALQREFAQNGISWKVNDAKRAGIHPLFALGAQTVAANPSYIGAPADNSMGAAVANMGQDVSRAIHATRTSDQRMEALGDLQIENQALQNDLLRSQIARLNGQVGPPIPIGNNSGQLVNEVPLEKVVSRPDAPHAEPSSVTDIGFTRTGSGYFPVMSNDAKQRLEEDMIGGFLWNFRNRFLPSFGLNQTRPPEKLKGDRVWWYNPFKQEYTDLPPPPRWMRR